MMNETQIKHMVDRFLGWKLPTNFNPDDGISFDPVMNKGREFESTRTPSGTNLLDVDQATAMVRYMVEKMPPSPASDADLLHTPEYARLCGIATVARALASVFPGRCIAAPVMNHPENCVCGQAELERALR